MLGISVRKAYNHGHHLPAGFCRCPEQQHPRRVDPLRKEVDELMQNSLTVYFDEPFWVGVFERTEGGGLSVCKVTFGAEPKDYEVWDYILQHYHELIFSPAIEMKTRQAADNPKRRRRNARKQLENTGIGTKSQQALQRQREEMKTELRKLSREEREAEAQRRFELKQAKKKEKRRGH